jgi:hypothetical protein
MTEVFCKALSDEHMYDLLHMFGRAWVCMTLGFSLSVCSVFLSVEKKCIQVNKKKRVHGQNKKKNELIKD